MTNTASVQIRSFTDLALFTFPAQFPTVEDYNVFKRDLADLITAQFDAVSHKTRDRYPTVNEISDAISAESGKKSHSSFRALKPVTKIVIADLLSQPGCPFIIVAHNPHHLVRYSYLIIPKPKTKDD